MGIAFKGLWGNGLDFRAWDFFGLDHFGFSQCSIHFLGGHCDCPSNHEVCFAIIIGSFKGFIRGCI